MINNYTFRYNDDLSRFVSYDVTRNDNSHLSPASWFVRELKNIGEMIDKVFTRQKPMNLLTKKEQEDYNSAKICHICQDDSLPFITNCKKYSKVRDHSHLTGNICNQNKIEFI